MGLFVFGLEFYIVSVILGMKIRGCYMCLLEWGGFYRFWDYLLFRDVDGRVGIGYGDRVLRYVGWWIKGIMFYRGIWLDCFVYCCCVVLFVVLFCYFFNFT